MLQVICSTSVLQTCTRGGSVAPEPPVDSISAEPPTQRHQTLRSLKVAFQEGQFQHDILRERIKWHCDLSIYKVQQIPDVGFFLFSAPFIFGQLVNWG